MTLSSDKTESVVINARFHSGKLGSYRPIQEHLASLILQMIEDKDYQQSQVKVSR